MVSGTSETPKPIRNMLSDTSETPKPIKNIVSDTSETPNLTLSECSEGFNRRKCYENQQHRQKAPQRAERQVRRRCLCGRHSRLVNLFCGKSIHCCRNTSCL
jgi:hypothetical protein